MISREFVVVIHYIPMLVAIFVWSNLGSRRSVLSTCGDIVGIIGIIFSIVLIQAYLSRVDPSVGGFLEWFLIFSMLTLGLLPLATVTLCVFAGRLIGRAISHRIKRMRSRTSPR